MSRAWSHQRESLAFGEQAPFVLDASDPGTGKTFVWIMDFARQRAAGGGRCLVVAPLTLLDAAWANDINEYAPHLSFSLATSGRRKEAFDSGADMVLINADGVKDIDIKWLKGFTSLIIDEFTLFKHMSARTKAMMKIAKLFTSRRILSGTPMSRSVTELWAPMYILDGGRTLGTSFTSFRNAVQTSTQVGPSPNMRAWKDKPGITETVFHMLKPYTIRHVFADVMTHVPPNHKRTVTFDLPPKARAAYDKMELDAVLQFESGEVTSAVHAASLRTKLLQIASGAVYSNAGYNLIDNSRYELISDLVTQEGRCVVSFNWKHQRDELIKALAKKKLRCDVIDGDVSDTKRSEIVARFQRGELDAVLMHPKTGAFGLTLTAGDATIITSPIYEADVRKQFIARIYRGSQDKVTNTITIEARNTAEQFVVARNEDGNERMEDFLAMVARRRQRG